DRVDDLHHVEKSIFGTSERRLWALRPIREASISPRLSGDEPPGAPTALRHRDRDRARPPALDPPHAVDVPGLPRHAHAVRLQVRLAQALTLGAERPHPPGWRNG